jgi:cell division protein FtsB
MRPRSAGKRARPVVTGRALVLGAVVVLLVVLLASPLHRYLSSRSDVSATQRQLNADKLELAKLRHQQMLWSDPGYIQSQARQRLQFAMPGDTVFQVVDKGARSGIEKTAGADGTRGAKSSTWNERLWSSLEAADK